VVRAFGLRVLVAWLVHLVLALIDPGGQHGHALIAVCVFLAMGLTGGGGKEPDRQA
jgi:hypothetical protein